MSPARRVPEPGEYLDQLFDISTQTVAVIKQILDRNDIYYKSKMLKADLVQLFHEKRPSMLKKHQADGRAMEMCEDKVPIATSNKHGNAVGEEEDLLCQAKLAMNGNQCGNPAHAGYSTCGIKAHRAQESQLSKAPVQDSMTRSLFRALRDSIADSSSQKTPESSRHTAPETVTGKGSDNIVENLAGETRRLKALLDATTAENGRLKALYDTTAAENVRLSLAVSSITDENLRTKSTLFNYRGKVDKMITVFEEIFGEDEIL